MKLVNVFIFAISGQLQRAISDSAVWYCFNIRAPDYKLPLHDRYKNFGQVEMQFNNGTSYNIPIAIASSWTYCYENQDLKSFSITTENLIINSLFSIEREIEIKGNTAFWIECTNSECNEKCGIDEAYARSTEGERYYLSFKINWNSPTKSCSFSVRYEGNENINQSNYATVHDPKVEHYFV